MKPACCKQKGRAFQQFGAREILAAFEGRLETGDVKSISMGASGSDLVLSPLARRLLPYDFEFKCQEEHVFSVWSTINQCVARCGEGLIPIVVTRKNHTEPIAMIPLAHWCEMLAGAAGLPVCWEDGGGTWSARETIEWFDPDSSGTYAPSSLRQATGMCWLTTVPAGHNHRLSWIRMDHEVTYRVKTGVGKRTRPVSRKVSRVTLLMDGAPIACLHTAKTLNVWREFSGTPLIFNRGDPDATMWIVVPFHEFVQLSARQPPRP